MMHEGDIIAPVALRPWYCWTLNPCIRDEVQARRGTEQEVDQERFQDPDNEYGLFYGTTYEASDEETDKYYD